MKRVPSLLGLLILLGMSSLNAQTIGTFTSVEPNPQDELFHIPGSHTWQLLISAGDNLTAGGTMPVNSDFTGYVPIGGSSEQGYLGINSEFVPGGHTVLDIQFDNIDKLWDVTASEAVDFSALGNLLVPGTSVNCSGAVTPWGTIVSCEENVVAGDLNNDGYLDFGWNIEIDPVTKKVIDQDGDNQPDKLWAMGRMKHENVVVAADSQTVYYGDDDSGSGFVFKYICDQKTKLSSGTLFVLVQNDSTGNWVQIANTTQSDRNNTVSLADAAGGTKFIRVEDVDIGPDGKVYFASTTQSRVFRFRDNGSTISDFEIFVDNQAFDINYAGGVKSTTFSGADNLVFDGEGNLWVTQDGGDKHIWMVRPNHTAANPSIEVFANTPAGCEPTGITFSPDYRFMFLSLQHPASGNTATQTDAAGQTIAFDHDATIVIALNDDLGNSNAITGPVKDRPGLFIEDLFPNPTDDQVLVKIFSEKATAANMLVYDIQGRLVVEKAIQLTSGTTSVNFSARDFASGKYYLSIRIPGDWTGKKFYRK